MLGLYWTASADKWPVLSIAAPAPAFAGSRACAGKLRKGGYIGDHIGFRV